MLMIEERCEDEGAPAARLELCFESRCKSRLRATLASGEAVGLLLPRGTVLRGGDRLRAADGRIVEVVAAAEALIEALCADARLLARAAYHLGNRHVAVEVGEGWLRLAADHVLEAMLVGLGCEVRHLTAPFEPEAGAYASGHRHSDEGVEGRGPRIHQYRAA